MRSAHAELAVRIAESFFLPWTVNYLHTAQLENLLTRLQLEGNSVQKETGVGIAALWRGHLAEGIFALENPSWEDAWRMTIGMHRDIVSPVPQPSHLLHLACAKLSQATHYLSLHPASRQVSKQM